MKEEVKRLREWHASRGLLCGTRTPTSCPCSQEDLEDEPSPKAIRNTLLRVSTSITDNLVRTVLCRPQLMGGDAVTETGFPVLMGMTRF